MKPFNLEQAKAGKPVCTRDGGAARIICFDAKSGDFPIIALIHDEDGEETPETFTVNGTYYKDALVRGTDLRMASVEQTMWVNLYRRSDQSIYVGSGNYPTEQQAKAEAMCGGCYVGTYPITYED